MLYASLFSLIIHVIAFILIKSYNIFFQLNNTYINDTKNNHIIITLLPTNDFSINKKLEISSYSLKKKYYSEKSMVSNIQTRNQHSKNTAIKSNPAVQNTLNYNDNKIISTCNKDNCMPASDNHQAECKNNLNNIIVDDFSKKNWPIQYIHPEYPYQSKILGIEGELRVMYDINNIGKVKNIRILFANPTGIFEENVKTAMRRWKYEQNKPKYDLIISFKFSLNNTKTKK